MPRKWTDEYIDNQLLDRKIKRLDACLNSRVSIRWMCLSSNCSCIWQNRPNNVITANQGCPKCAGKLKITDDIIDERINNRPIKRIGHCSSGQFEKIDFQCTDCFNIWNTMPYTIFQGKGCPKCNEQRLNDNIIDERLVNLPITRIGNYINNHTKILFQCKICNHIWSTRWNTITNGSGCPECNVSGNNEKLLRDLLRKYEESFEHDYDICNINSSASNRYRLDIYYPKFKLAIEYNGKQHYIPSDWGSLSKEGALETLKHQQKRDEYVDQFCKSNSINIIWIDGRKFYGKKLIKFVEDNILPLISKDKI